MEQIITREYLQEHPNEIFVFGDNLLRIGNGGAAKLRDMPNTYGFVTKKAPTYNDEDFFTVEEYLRVYTKEIEKLTEQIRNNKDKTYLISKVGAGLANRHHIWECVIVNTMKVLIQDQIDEEDDCRVKFLW